MFSLTHWQLATVVAAAVIFVLSIFLGARSGLARSRSQIVLANSSHLIQGLDFFHNDQNRFPSDPEFADQNIMRDYLTPFPLPQIPGLPCPKSYSYHNTGFNSYQLFFCLAVPQQQYRAGWNVYNKQ